MIKQIIEKTYKENEILPFSLLEKAFDRVQRQKLWNILKRRGEQLKAYDNVQFMIPKI